MTISGKLEFIGRARFDIEIRRICRTAFEAERLARRKKHRVKVFTYFSLEQIELGVTRLASHPAGSPGAARSMARKRSRFAGREWYRRVGEPNENDRYCTPCSVWKSRTAWTPNVATAITLPIDSAAVLLPIQHGDNDTSAKGREDDRHDRNAHYLVHFPLRLYGQEMRRNERFLAYE